MTTPERPEPESPLVELIEAAREALAHLTNLTHGKPCTHAPDGCICGALDATTELQAALARAQRFANEQPDGARACRHCSKPLDDLDELARRVLRVVNRGQMDAGAELADAAVGVAGYCSEGCWILADLPSYIRDTREA